MPRVNEEKIILITLGWTGQAELFNKIVDEYNKKYLNKFSGDLENIEIFANAYYRTIINIAIYGIDASKYKVKMHKNKILEIDIPKVYEDYKEYIEEIKEHINEFNNFQERLLREFKNNSNK